MNRVCVQCGRTVMTDTWVTKWHGPYYCEKDIKGGCVNDSERQAKIKELRERADRTEKSVSSNAGPSSQEWVSPERRAHYRQLALADRLEADRLEREGKTA